MESLSLPAAGAHSFINGAEAFNQVRCRVEFER